MSLLGGYENWGNELNVKNNGDGTYSVMQDGTWVNVNAAGRMSNLNYGDPNTAQRQNTVFAAFQSALQQRNAAAATPVATTQAAVATTPATTTQQSAQYPRYSDQEMLNAYSYMMRQYQQNWQTPNSSGVTPQQGLADQYQSSYVDPRTNGGTGYQSMGVMNGYSAFMNSIRNSPYFGGQNYGRNNANTAYANIGTGYQRWRSRINNPTSYSGTTATT